MKDWEKKVRTWAWERLVFLADRISPEDAFRYTSYSMRMRKGHGWVFEEHDGKNGVKLWYKGSREYKEHAYDGYDEEPEIKVSSDMAQEDLERSAKNLLWWAAKR